MKGLRGISGALRSEKAGLLKTGAFSLFFHIVILAFLTLSLGSGGGSSIYHFTIRPYSPGGDGRTKGGFHPGLIRSPGEKTRGAKTAIQKRNTLQEKKHGISPDRQKKTVQRGEAAADVAIAAVAKDVTQADPSPLKQAKANSAGTGKGIGQGSGMGQGGSGTGLGEGEEGFGWGWSGISSPRYAQNPKPVYPQEAREKGYQGKVLLRVEVLANGRVGQVAVKKSSGCEVLDRSALAAVREWRFVPARKGEAAVPVWVIIPIKFQLL
jgi:TonB family protein